MELFYMPQFWILLFEVAHDWVILLHKHIAKLDLSDGLYPNVSKNVNGFNFTKKWIKLFSFAQI